MAYKIGINGFGRIGRQVLKAIDQGGFSDLFEVVAVNDLTDNQTLAHLLKYDSTYGRYDAEISANDEGISVNGHFVKVLEEKDPAQLPWGDLGVDLVIESTGRFTDSDKASAHIDAGAKKVIISAPAKGEDITVVLGVNEALLRPGQAQHHFERLLHHELPCPGGQGRARHLRYPARHDDHCSLLHRRPGAAGRAAQ